MDRIAFLPREVPRLGRLPGQFVAEPAFQLLWMRLLGLRSVAWKTELTVVGQHLRQRSAVQDGLVATLADATAGYAAFTATELGDSEDVATVEFKTVFYQPAVAPTLLCRASVIRVGGGVVFCAAAVGASAGDPDSFAAATLTFRRLRAPGSTLGQKGTYRDAS